MNYVHNLFAIDKMGKICQLLNIFTENNLTFIRIIHKLLRISAEITDLGFNDIIDYLRIRDYFKNNQYE